MRQSVRTSAWPLQTVARLIVAASVEGNVDRRTAAAACARFLNNIMSGRGLV